ncbi:MAG: hypothetical protein MUO52_15875, partial [Desulfobacterales bacterium]|nr:hypothetical protein [Desulfobacterales bacterium]
KRKKSKKILPQCDFLDFLLPFARALYALGKGAEAVTVQRNGNMIHPPLDQRSNAHLARI